jgi:hypothetical protein
MSQRVAFVRPLRADVANDFGIMAVLAGGFGAKNEHSSI